MKNCNKNLTTSICFGLLSSLRALTGASVLCFSAVHVSATEFMAAGVPVELAESRDYARIFSHLKSNGVSVFFPTFQYLEAPSALSLGFETDFVAPCSPDGPAFRAMAETGIKIVIPAELVYPQNAGMPDLDQDPLAQLIACAGRAQIYGVSNYDEPVFQSIKLKKVQALYNRVKEIDSTIPVLMVHGPLVLDKPEFASEEQRAEYLQKVASFSAYADIVGFDVYPVTADVAKVGSPDSGGNIVGYADAIPSYINWLRVNLPNKQHLMVYQGFSYVDMFEKSYLRSLISADDIAAIRPPNRKELSSMIAAAVQSDLSLVVFWGQGMLNNLDQAPWPDIIDIVKAYRN